MGTVPPAAMVSAAFCMIVKLSWGAGDGIRGRFGGTGRPAAAVGGQDLQPRGSPGPAAVQAGVVV